jgi:hypothetical protein
MTVAGAPADLLGLIEGLADLSAATLSYCTGWLSNRSGKRKVLVLIDYGFSTLARLIVAYPRESLRAAWQTLSPDFKRYLVCASIFSLVYFSFKFLLLRAHRVDFSA